MLSSVAANPWGAYDCNHMKTQPAKNLLPNEFNVGALPPLAGVTPVPRSVPAGTTLFRQGDPTLGIFVLAQGSMRLVRVTPDGGNVTLHLARPGENFAEASLFSKHYHCDALADSNSVVGLYPKAQLIAQLRGDPDALWDFTGELARRLQGLRQRYELKQIRSAPERVLQFLRLRCDDAGHFCPTGTLKEIATELGLTHEALYRAITSLEQRRLISRREGSLGLAPGRRRVRKLP